MTFEERVSGDVTVVVVTGDLSVSDGADVKLRDKVRSLLQQNRKKLVLDLANLSYVDSGGLGQLVFCHVTVANAGGALKLLNMTDRLREILAVTNLATVFDSYIREADALQSF